MKKVFFLSCLWADLAYSWVDGQGRPIDTLPPGGTQIGHQRALLDCKRYFLSAVCGPIWLTLGSGLAIATLPPNRAQIGL